MTSRTWGRLASSIAMLRAFVITVSERSFRKRICRAISAVVVPESSMMVSPSLIIWAAAWPILTFSEWWSVSFTMIGTSSGASVRLRAPPWERTTAPPSERASRSPRMVTAETPNRPTSSSTVTFSCPSSISRIRRRLSSTRRRGGRALAAPAPSFFRLRMAPIIRSGTPWRMRTSQNRPSVASKCVGLPRLRPPWPTHAATQSSSRAKRTSGGPRNDTQRAGSPRRAGPGSPVNRGARP